MKIGSRVQIQREREGGDTPKGVLLGVHIGTCIGVDEECDGDGYSFIAGVSIRFDNGKVETIPTCGEDEHGFWDVVDVTPRVYANLYLMARAYGGPEEGGWWYTTYTPADGEWATDPPQYGLMPSEELAELAVAALEAWCAEENSTRRSIYSMASAGHFVVFQEAWPPEPSPKRKPHYC